MICRVCENTGIVLRDVGWVACPACGGEAGPLRPGDPARATAPAPSVCPACGQGPGDRAAVVAWLRFGADRGRGTAAWDETVGAMRAELADAIERGDHRAGR